MSPRSSKGAAAIDALMPASLPDDRTEVFAWSGVEEEMLRLRAWVVQHVDEHDALFARMKEGVSRLNDAIARECNAKTDEARAEARADHDAIDRRLHDLRSELWKADRSARQLLILQALGMVYQVAGSCTVEVVTADGIRVKVKP